MTVREASIQWISLAIQSERPHEKLPEQLADELLRTAESEDIPVEDLAKWIHMLPEQVEISVIACERWARAWHFELGQQKKRGARHAERDF